MFRIQPATLDDIPALIRLMAEFYAESGYPLPEANARAAFTTLISTSHLGGVWLAWEGDEPVGHIVLTVSFSMEYGAPRGFIDDLFVSPAARGRGIAGALIEAVVAAAPVRNVRALLVEVGSVNDAGHRAYDKAGFADTGHRLLSRQLGAPLHAG